MNIPTLPTDNLYKFYAIGGLFVLILSAYYLLENIIKIDEEKIKIKSEINIAKLNINKFKKRISLIEKEGKEFCVEHGLSCQSLEDLTERDLADPNFPSKKLKILLDKHKTQLDENEEMKSKIEEATVNLDNYVLSYDYKNLVFANTLSWYLLFIVGSLYFMTIGLFRWSVVEKQNDYLRAQQLRSAGLRLLKCQSCGAKLEYDFRLPEIQPNSVQKFCTNCYDYDLLEYIDPNITLSEMLTFVSNEMKLQNLPFLVIRFHLIEILFLERWKKEYRPKLNKSDVV